MHSRWLLVVGVLLFASAVSVIGALQMFDQSFIAGGADGAPANALTTVVLYLYRSPR